MYVLLGFSVVSLTFILERLSVLHRVPGETRAEGILEDVEEVLKGEGKAAVAERCAKGRGFMNYVFAALLKRHDTLVLEERDENAIRDELILTTDEASRKYLGRFFQVLSTIGTVSPLLGLLGTIMGMISAFAAIAKAGTGDPQVVAAGISEALLTTAAGLIIAIPTIIFYRYLAARADNVIERTEIYFHAFASSLLRTSS